MRAMKRATMRASGNTAASAAANNAPARSATRRATLNLLDAGGLNPADASRSREDWIALLIEEETAYVAELNVLHDVYTAPLLRDMNSARPQLLQPNPVMTVFLGNVGHIYNLNQNFLQELQKRAADDGHVGPVVARFAPLFKMYGQYASAHDEVLTIISENNAGNAPFADFMATAQADGRSRGNNVQTLAGAPLRRIPRYIAVLRSLVALTPEGHADLADITGALAQMETTMGHVRSQIEQREATEQITALEATWDVKFVKPRRRLVKQGLLTKVSRRKDIEYMFVLFNDAIAYGAATQGGRYSHHRTMSLRNMRIDEVGGSDPTAFQIMSEKSFVVHAASQQDKYDWMTAIMGAIAEFDDGGGDDDAAGGDALAPVWVPDSNATNCALCNAKFTLVRRRHHCRRCGICVCDGCSPEQFPMNVLVKSSTQTTMKRACAQCAIQVRNEQDNPAALSPAAGEHRPSVTSASPRHPSTATRPQVTVKALYDFAADDAGQLSLTAGCSYVILERNEDWWYGHLEGQPEPAGWAPTTFCEEERSAAVRAAEAAQAEAVAAEEAQRAAAAANADKTARTRVAEEILSTEVTYVRNLEALFEVYIAPLLADGESAKPKIGKIVSVASPNNLTSMAVFFHNVEHMLTLNRQLLADLQARVTGWTDDRTMGDIFEQYGPLFSMYAQYSNSQEFAGSTIKAWQDSKPAFAAFLEECDQDPRCAGQNIQSMLIMPIQRVPRYQLLLAELRKQTAKKEPEHADLPLLDQALDTVKDSAMVINEQIKLRENREQIQELESKWGVRLDKVDRVFKRQGPLLKQCRRAPKQFEFLLFSDALMYGERNATVPGAADSYKYHRTINLKECQVQPLPSSDVGFQIASTSKSFVAMADTPALAQSWMSDIQGCIDELRAASGADGEANVAPVWVPDAHATRCTFCQDSFTTFKRRHHCRVCGAVACQSCSSARRLVPNVDPNKKVRVCDPCAKRQDDQGSVAGSGGFAAAGETAAAAAATAGGAHPAHWVANSEASNCLVCNAKFGVARRRHHCRCCGHVVCDPCTDSVALDALNDHGESKFSTKPVRTCKTCQRERLEPALTARAADSSGGAQVVPPMVPAHERTLSEMTAAAVVGGGLALGADAGAAAAAAAAEPDIESDSDSDDEGPAAELTIPGEATALYAYVATEENELSLSEGARVRVTEKNGDWVFCELLDGGGDGWSPMAYLGQ